MKIKIKFEDIELEIDRPNFIDYNNSNSNGPEWRNNLMKDTIIPQLKEMIEKAKELYLLKNS